MPSANEPRTSVFQRSGPLLGNSIGAGFRLSRYSQITLLSKIGVLSSSTSAGIFPNGLALLISTLVPGLVSMLTISIWLPRPFTAIVSLTFRPYGESALNSNFVIVRELRGAGSRNRAHTTKQRATKKIGAGCERIRNLL